MTWALSPLVPLSYSMIMADPPWDFALRSKKGETAKTAAGQYRCMSIADIKAMPVADLGRGDALLWLWATHPMIDQQIDVCRAWGFKFVTTGAWVKTTKPYDPKKPVKLAFGTGYRLRCASEPFIIGTLGRPETVKNIRTAFLAPVRDHSRKPDEAYEIAERMMPGALRRADVFSRQQRPGWESFGDEIGKFAA
jgi:N6-adenosine-specific RNA methylase IME4